MNVPGLYPLIFRSQGDFSIASAPELVGDWITGLEGMTHVEAQISLVANGGGSSVQVYLQTTIDGTIPIDIACVAFTDTSKTVIVSLPREKMTTPYEPTDGALPDNTCKAGILGNALRLKVKTTGTYTGGSKVVGRAIIT